MSGEGPTVVQGPYYGRVYRVEVFEKYLVINVVAMNIVQMYDVGLYLLNTFYKTLCGKS
jgi:hypothetical protein